jgi:hypothetical protein
VNGPPHIKLGPALVGGSIQALSAKTSARAGAASKKGHFYKRLAKEFQRGGFTYRQIYREGDFAIYRQTWYGNEQSAAFEVIRIRRREAFQIGTRFVEPAEVYPNSEAWGVDGFTLTDKDAAFAKLSAMRAMSITEPCSLRRDGWKSKKGITEWKTPKTH